MPRTKTSFKPGNRASVGFGRKKLTPLEKADRQRLKAIKDNTNKEFLELAYELTSFKGKDLKKVVINREEESVLKGAMASILMRSMSKGDHRALNAILDRVIGPVKQQVDITTKDESINPQNDEKFDTLKQAFLQVIEAKKEWDTKQSSEVPSLSSEVSSQ